MGKAKKNIGKFTEDQFQGVPEPVKALIKKGQEQEFITYQELLKALPEAEENVILLDDIYTMFLDLNIEIIDTKDAIFVADKKEVEEEKDEKN